MYQAVFFDLDGTLLPIDTHTFMKSYFGALAAFFGARGLDARAVLAGVEAGTHAMFDYDAGATTNEERFWRAYVAFMDERGMGRTDWPDLFAAFYEHEFPKLKGDAKPNPLARDAVDLLARKGYRLLLTTNPLFPPQATLERLAWTGIEAGRFERITTYDNSRFAKPSREYYAENLRAAGLNACDVLMVGNDPVEDGTARELGCGLFLVTDCYVDRAGAGTDLASTPHGTMADLLEFVQGLPDLAADAPAV